MDEKTKLILALHQVNNIVELTKDNEWSGFIAQKMISVKCELERQLSLLTNPPQLSKIKE